MVPRTFMMIRRSAFPVRISYSANDRSEPMLARTDASARLKRTEVTVSVEVGRVRLEMAALLKDGCPMNAVMKKALASDVLCFIPYLD